MLKEKLILTALLIFIFFLFLHPIQGDGDFFHHLNTGKYVVEHASLPQTDEFTFTAHGRPWVGYAWGAGTVFYLIYKSLGPTGINIFVALTAVLTFALLYFLLKLLGVDYKNRFLALILAAVPLSTRFPARPEIFTYPFLLGLFLTNELRKNSNRLSPIIPLIVFLWANFYGSSVIVGLSVIIVFLAIETIRDKFHFKDRLFYISSFFAFPLAFINGYSWKTVFYIFFIPQISQTQTEWGGIFKNLTGPIDYVLSFQNWLLIYLLYLFIVTILLVVSFKKISKNLSIAIFALGIFAPFFAFRQLPVSIILSLPFIAILIPQKRKKQVIIALLIIVVSIYSLFISLSDNPIGTGQSEDSFPPKLVSFIKDHKLYGRAFNNQQIGGFLTYNIYPNLLVFYDTRDDLFINSKSTQDFYYTLSTMKSVIPLLSKYKIDVVVGDLSDGLSYQPLFYSNNWSVIYLNSTYFIAVPHKYALLHKLYVFKSIDPFSISGAKKGKEKEALAEYTNNLTSDISWNGKLRLGVLYFYMKDYDKALSYLNQIHIPNSPTRPFVETDQNYLFAQIYFAKNDCLDLKKYLDLTQKSSIGKFIFMPSRVIPSQVNKGYTFYYMLCENNPPLSQKYLKLYLDQTDIDLQEKTSTLNQYKQISNEY